jgi:hypothetical protein
MTAMAGELTIDEWLALEFRDEIRCPHCDAAYPDEDHYMTSYWGEDGPQDAICDSCEKDFLVQEQVTRRWATFKPPEAKDP